MKRRRFARFTSMRFLHWGVLFSCLCLAINLLALSIGNQPELDVERPSGTPIADGTTDDVGDRSVGTVTLSYYIYNRGTALLTITGATASNYSNCSGFSSSETFPMEVAAGGGTKLTVSFDIDGTGAFDFDMAIASDDADEDPYDIEVSGTGVGPELDVERPSGTGIDDGGTDDVGSQAVGTVTLHYYIYNRGTGPLTISGATATNHVNSSGFSVTTSLPLTVAASGSSKLTVDFNVDGDGAFSFDIDIASDDADESPYDIAVSGTSQPTLTIVTVGAFGGDNVDSTGGTPTPSAIDCPGGTVCVASFEPNDVVTLDVTVDPASSFQGWSGDCAAFGAALSGAITMDDCKVCTATFVAVPDIDVERPAGTTIPDGGTDAIGNQAPATHHLTYAIDNSAGGAELSVTGVTASSLVNTSDFGVASDLPLAVPAGSTATLRLQFDVDALGAFSLDVHIANNDPDETPYDIQITGTGAAVPEIDARGNDITIFNGDDSPRAGDLTDFGNVPVGGGSKTHTFTVRNTGLASLSLTGGSQRVTIGGPHAGDFTVTSDAAASVAADAETTFEITFQPSALGTRQATISIPNTDSDENPYEFAIEGTGVDFTAPSATTAAATEIGSTTATLNGIVNAHADSTAVEFHYGLSPSYGAVVAAIESPLTGSTDAAVMAVVTNLAPNTTYYFRVAAQNSVGTTYGEPMTFSTLMLGDINGDRVVDVLDARLCLQIAQGTITATPAQRDAADVDGDGDVDMDDAEILAEYVIGKRASLP